MTTSAISFPLQLEHEKSLYPWLLTPLAILLAWIFFPLPPIPASPDPNLSLSKAATVQENDKPDKSLQPANVHTSATPATLLPLDFLLDPDPSKGKTLSERVLARLIQLEAHEPLPYFKDDYRQAFITVTLAARGNSMPFVVASYQMYGVHPDKLYEKVLARREALMGRTSLAPNTGEAHNATAQTPETSPAPKKPSQPSSTDKRGIA